MRGRAARGPSRRPGGRPARRRRSGGRRGGRPGRRGTARPAGSGRRGRPTARWPTSVRRRARAPPAVAAQTASSVVIPISRTASAMQNGMLLVKQEPGLQSVARATVAPASSRRRACGKGCLAAELHAGQQGRDHARADTRASTSASVRNVQWSADAAPASAATWTPGPGPSWLACTRAVRPAARPAARIAAGLVARRTPRPRRTRRPSGPTARRRPASGRGPGRRSRPGRRRTRAAPRARPGR